MKCMSCCDKSVATKKWWPAARTFRDPSARGWNNTSLIFSLCDLFICLVDHPFVQKNLVVCHVDLILVVIFQNFTRFVSVFLHLPI
mmetsp:Transcript_13858/g.25656  ORF Transcript_13858/g.25656 Transcript_13858/m.25656 type:complete len:86 (-) Transcript_13858:611-868(-)